MTEKPKWMSDPLVSHIDTQKLEFLGNLIDAGHGKSQKELMSHIMSIMAQAKKKNLSFTSSEVSTIITAIKKHSSPEELEKIDELMKKAPH